MIRQLTARQERDLVIAAEFGDSDACRGLVEAFLPAIESVARRFPNSRVERRELIQEGVAGLLFAARRYDAQLNTPFWAYASFWVRKAMQEFVAELARPVSLSDRAVRDLARLNRARREHQQEHRTEPTVEELSRETGLTRTQLESLEATARTPQAVDDEFTAERLVDPAAEQAYQQVLDDLEIGYLRDLTEELDDRESTVVRAHYGLGEPQQTLTEIGAALGLTAERARQIEVGALSKLRERLRPTRAFGRMSDREAHHSARSRAEASAVVAEGGQHEPARHAVENARAVGWPKTAARDPRAVRVRRPGRRGG